jgi:hypothetical protein
MNMTPQTMDLPILTAEGWQATAYGRLIPATFTSKGAAEAAIPIERRRYELRIAKTALALGKALGV